MQRAQVVPVLAALIIGAGLAWGGYLVGKRSLPAAGAPGEGTVKHAVAVMVPTEGSEASGVVVFEQMVDGLHIRGSMHDLSPGKHGFHVHEFGDLRVSDGSSAGGHFAPFDRPHGGPSDTNSHVGDLGNIEATGSGEADFVIIDQDVRLGGPASILGRCVVVHSREDDLTSQPSGAAGARVAFGVTGVAAGAQEPQE
jgi:Cu-Zn family superoxide dismutase